jgi:MFS family permease
MFLDSPSAAEYDSRESGVFNVQTKLGGKFWTAMLIFGLMGQVAWVVENMYFNVFIYKMFRASAADIALMVTASAVAATLTTILMGALSDRIGKRKIFMCAGYIAWGISIISFALIRADVISSLFGAVTGAASVGITLVIIMDCVMTFFGSTANDGAFNAYVTDVTNSANRGRAESVLAILPLISMLIIFGLFDGLTQQGRWREFFSIFGCAVTAVGVLAIFLVKDEPSLRPRRDSYFRNLLYGLRPAVVRGNPELYLALCAFCLFSVAVQVFFPFLIIYIQNYLGINDYAIVLGVVLILASAVSVVSGRFIDRVGKLRFVYPAAAIMLAGLAGMYFVRSQLGVMVAGTVMMSGYMMVSAALNATIRDWTPEGKVGHFQGIRMIFAVLLPMIIGPNIGAAVIRGSDSTYIELGQVKSVPTPGIYLTAAIILLFCLIPVFLLRRRKK